MPGYSAKIVIADDETRIGVSPPKGPHELDEVTISVTNDADGRPVDQMANFIKTGQPFTLSREQLQNITFPEKLQKLFGLTQGVFHSVTFTRKPPPPIAFCLIRLCDDGDRAELPVDLVCTQGGTEQMKIIYLIQGQTQVFGTREMVD